LPPLRDNTVRMYTCGLTVYARGHIGNFRTFVCVDVLRRALKYVAGYKMHHVMNFTDVDDKTIIGAAKAGMPLREYTDQYIKAFREDAAALRIEPVEDTPRATDDANLKAMADMINALDERGHTYKSDGSIYFKISTLPSYGKLARLDHEGIQAGARVDSTSTTRKTRATSCSGSRPSRASRRGMSAAAQDVPAGTSSARPWRLRLLGESPIDIHTGGVDLVFPHHENEIAQSEGATGKEFSRFWFHVEHLLVDNQKMSKSVGNVYSVQDVLDKGFRLSALRYILLSGYYRKQLNFTWTGLEQAEEALRRITDFLGRVESLTAGGAHDDVKARVKEAVDAFDAALRDDLNTAGRAGAIFDLIRALNILMTNSWGKGDAPEISTPSTISIAARRAVAARAEECDAAIPQAEIDAAIHARQEARRRATSRGRSHPPGPARQGRDLEDGRRHPLEEEITLDRRRWMTRSSDRPSGPKAKAISSATAVVSPRTLAVSFVMARGRRDRRGVDGIQFLDCAAGIAVNSTGHSHPEVVAAIIDQAQKFLHMSGTDFYYEPQVRLAEAFNEMAPFGGEKRSFFSNSGTEAIEAAIKLARYVTKRYGMIAFLGSFHGRTLGSLALTSSKAIQRRGFGPMQAGTFHTPYGNCYRCPVGLKPESCQAECLDFLEHQILVHLVSPDEVAGVVVEPIQGEGGYVVPEPKFHQRLRDITKKHGILLIADEVQSGMGRTGKMFAIEHFGVEPDMVAVAKGVASGLPLGVTTAKGRRDVVAAGLARQHLRGQPRVVRRPRSKRSSS
jgi:4-aminobutyrate aminotransferase-like enzyme